MPTGVLINASAVLVGGLLGVGLGRFVPKELRATLNLMFGLCSMAMGVSQIAGLSALAPLVLSIILGAGVGCAMHWERAIAKAADKLRGPLNAILRSDGVAGVAQDEWMARYVAAVVLFCASGTGIYGAMQEGLSGDPSILVTKAVLDFFTAMIFACDLGIMLPLVAELQLAVLLVLYALAGVILPLTDAGMIANFKATGGILMLATGFRITQIKNFPVADMLPAMIFVMPLTAWYVGSIVPLL